MSVEETIQTIRKHRSVRRFARRGLPVEVKLTLLECAIRAPTTAMGHFYSIIEVADGSVRGRLRQICGGQVTLPQGTMFIFDLDLHRSSLWAVHLGVQRMIDGFTGLILATLDAALTALNLSLAAESLGLGTVFIGTVGHSGLEVNELLDLPTGVLPVIGLIVGYPAEHPAIRPRTPLAYLHHVDSCQDTQPAEIEAAISAIGNWSTGEAPAKRDQAQRRAFARTILGGRWWVDGEESLRRALVRQGMSP